ncbi:MAG: hypothetical protein E5W70_29260 [Mesorhizobium sp.]|nr:MAG: hypothetical protein E5W70_29260 [Mesorhizobium sp.]
MVEAGQGRRDSTPFCPAGHLPLRWGDWMSPLIWPIANVAKGVLPTKLPISPLEGEMAGRTERGGAAHRRLQADLTPARSDRASGC